jgi:predicted Zn-dependent protease
MLACLASASLPAADVPLPAPVTLTSSVALAELRHGERWGELQAAATIILGADAANAEAHAALVEALWRQGRAPEAVAAAEKARAASADSAALRLSLASAWSLLARWSDVTQTLAADLDPATASADALLLAGIAQREQGQLDAARQRLEILTRRYPADRRGWVNLARLELGVNRPAQALGALQHLSTESVEVLYLKARAQALGGQSQVAIATITQALEKAPERASFYALRASLLANLQEWPAAARDIHTALLLGARGAEDYLLACEAARMLGDGGALASYARAGLVAHPRRIEFPVQLARALREQGKLQESLTLLTAAQKAFPDNTTLVLESAVSQSMLGRDADVVTTLTPLLAQQPLAQAYALRAYAHMRLGLQARADEDATNALALDPGQVNALLVQARIALLQQQVPRAATACQKALGRAPALAWAYTTCGEVAMVQEKTDDARRLVERALLLSPEDAEARQLRDRLRDTSPGSGGQP